MTLPSSDLEDDFCRGVSVRANADCRNSLEKNQMTCLECGGTMRTRREVVPFEKPIGLPGVRVSTFVARCPKCGAYEVMLPNLEGLHQAIARAVIAKKERLAPAEVRFLRKVLGWSGADFAEYMGTSAETVSRWETGATPIGPQADRLLRVMVMNRDPVSDYRKLDLLKTVARAKPAAVRMLARADGGGWRVKSDAA
jgi:putative zinc finger/helix-turn-helix YgiT family protein